MTPMDDFVEIGVCAGIDPLRKLVDRDRGDNVVEVKVQNGDAL